MIKTKLALILDSILISFLIFSILFVWLNKIVKSALLTFIISILFSLAVFFMIFSYFKKKNNIRKLKLNDIKLAENSFNQISILSSKRKTEFFKNLFNAEIVEKNFYKKNSTLILIELNRNLELNDFFNLNDILESDKLNSVIIISTGQSKDFIELLNLSKINYYIFSKADLFEFMKEKNIFPTFNEINKKNKFQNIKFLLTSSINRTNFKNFLVSGLSLIFISLFIPFSLYYLIFGSLFIIVSIICLFLRNQSNVKEQNKNLSGIIKGD